MDLTISRICECRTIWTECYASDPTWGIDDGVPPSGYIPQPELSVGTPTYKYSSIWAKRYAANGIRVAKDMESSVEAFLTSAGFNIPEIHVFVRIPTGERLPIWTERHTSNPIPMPSKSGYVGPRDSVPQTDGLVPTPSC